jgi:hypothetical protein
MIDGAIVIDPGRGFQLLPRMDDGMRATSVRESVRYLADNDRLEASVEGAGHGSALDSVRGSCWRRRPCRTLRNTPVAGAPQLARRLGVQPA